MEQTPRYLFIVSRDQPDLNDYLRREFSADKEVQVLSDRRVAERRQRAQACEPERRQAGRRSQPGIDHDLRTLGFVIVKQSGGSSAR